MATITPNVTQMDDNCVKIAYAGMALNDVGAPIPSNVWGAYTDRNVSVFGTFGAGGAVAIEGSNNTGTTYHTLNDPSDNQLSITTAKNEQILAMPEYTRPSVTAGDGTTSLSVIFMLRRVAPKFT